MYAMSRRDENIIFFSSNRQQNEQYSDRIFSGFLKALRAFCLAISLNTVDQQFTVLYRLFDGYTSCKAAILRPYIL